MKNVSGFLVALMLVMPVASQAFEITGDQVVAGVQTPAVKAPVVRTVVARPTASLTAKRVKDLIGKTAGLERAVNNNSNKLEENTNNIAGLTTAMENLTKGFDFWGTSLKNHTSNVALILGAVFVLCIAGLGIYLGALFNRRSEEITTAVREGVAETRAAIDTVPERTAAVIRTLDPSPFVFNVAGNEVSYQSPVECAAEGYYLELHVPKDEQGTAATYERGHQTARGVAQRNCAKTMRLYFEGKFDAPATEYKLQKELIEHLVATGAIKYRKLS
ncbi:MAG: hypothetical protein HGA61_03055 [Candidatus Moranbacteria bacterium]|nr:hypothetical protein [Candidatus Moranbacteria bacterium]